MPRVVMSHADERIVELLELILRVQSVLGAAGKGITEGARLLKLAGLDNQMIADVLNTSAGTVRTVTANLRAIRGAGHRARRRR